MSEQVTNGVLIAAGQGSRLRPLTDTTDKAMIRVGHPQEDPLAERPNGTPVIEISFANLVRAGIQNIAVVQNPDRDVERYYGSTVDSRVLLERQGRWHDSLKGVIYPFVTISYAVQPKEFYHKGQKKYGTGIWPLLVGGQIEEWQRQGARQFLLSEADSLPYCPNGDTPITRLVKKVENYPDSSAILLMPFNDNAAPDYGFGAVEDVDGELFFLGVQETKLHPPLGATRGGKIRKYKNVTRAVIGLDLYRAIRENAEIEPPAVNDGETHVLDGYRRFMANGGEILPVISGPDDEFINFGDPKSLRHADQRLRGLSQNPPVWDFRQAAQYNLY